MPGDVALQHVPGMVRADHQTHRTTRPFSPAVNRVI
jgi:hypothetical protein